MAKTALSSVTGNQDTSSPPSNADASPEASNQQTKVTLSAITLTNGIQNSLPVQDLQDKVPANIGKLYIHMNPIAPAGSQHVFSGKILDGSGRIIFTHTMNVTATPAPWYVWFYHRIKNDDQPGKWTFILSIDGKTAPPVTFTVTGSAK